MSTITVSSPSARARARPLRVASTASFVSVRKTGTWICLPSCSSWSIAAGRCRSAAIRPGLRPWLRRCSASFAAVVVLPEPCRPASRMTVNLPNARPDSPSPISCVSSSWTTFTTCWPGVRLFRTVLAERLLAHAGDEVADDGEVDVGLEQREPDLAHRARDRLLVELALLAEVAEGALQLVGKAVEHDRAS